MVSDLYLLPGRRRKVNSLPAYACAALCPSIPRSHAWIMIIYWSRDVCFQIFVQAGRVESWPYYQTPALKLPEATEAIVLLPSCNKLGGTKINLPRVPVGEPVQTADIPGVQWIIQSLQGIPAQSPGLEKSHKLRQSSHINNWFVPCPIYNATENTGNENLGPNQRPTHSSEDSVVKDK